MKKNLYQELNEYYTDKPYIELLQSIYCYENYENEEEKEIYETLLKLQQDYDNQAYQELIERRSK